jgi:hypothetical protein
VFAVDSVLASSVTVTTLNSSGAGPLLGAGATGGVTFARDTGAYGETAGLMFEPLILILIEAIRMVGTPMLEYEIGAAYETEATLATRATVAVETGGVTTGAT